MLGWEEVNLDELIKKVEDNAINYNLLIHNSRYIMMIFDHTHGGRIKKLFLIFQYVEINNDDNLLRYKL